MKKPIQQQPAPGKNGTVQSPFQRLALHSAVAMALVGGGYGRGAYAGSCTPGPVSVCSGPANDGVDVTQNLSGTSLTVTTSAGFGIDTSSAGGMALELRGDDGLTFTDANTSQITGWLRGIDARNTGSGALTVVSNGTVAGAWDFSHGIYARNSDDGTDLTIQSAVVTGGNWGIDARNQGSGALSVTSNGKVTGSIQHGISAINVNGTDLSIQTAAVSGGIGIRARNYGSGALSISSSGVVTGTRDGIKAHNYGNGMLRVTSSAEVKGGFYGIDARNSGSGALRVTSSKAVTGGRIGIYANNRGTDLTLQVAAVTGTGTVGIRARNYGTNLTLKTLAVSGGVFGIYAQNLGSGALSITSSEAVTGTSGTGAFAHNVGTDLTLQTATVTGGNYGIFARNWGSGALNVTSSGVVTGTNSIGILAENSGTNLTLQTAAVTSDSDAIMASNTGNGALSITTSGAVTGNLGIGIMAGNYGTDLILQTEAVRGGLSGIQVSHNGEGILDITTNGPVTGGRGSALRLTRFIGGTTGGVITNNGGLVSKENTAVWMASGMNFVGEFNNNADITGGNGTAFDASAATHGIVFNQAAGTIAGNVLLGIGDDRVNITGGSINGKIIGQGFGTVAIDVGAGEDFNGNGVVNVADYIIQSGTVHQRADFSTAATTTTVANGATLSFSSLIHGGGALVSNGDLGFVLRQGSNGELLQAGTVTLNDGSTITLDTNGLSPTLHESFQLISATSIVDKGVVVAEDAFGSLLYDFDALIGRDSLSVVTTVANLGVVSPLPNPAAFGASMTAFVSGGGDNAVVALLAGLGSGDIAGFEQIADVFSPSVSGAVSQGAREASDSTWRLINERLVGSETVLHISEPPNGVWLQGYGGTTDQDDLDQVDGFDADTSGIALGYDVDLGQWRVGAAFSAGETNIDNDRFASDSIDIESKQFIVYGGIWQDQWFANATASLASLDYDFKRNNLIAGEGSINSDSEGDLLGLSVGAGYKYTVADTVVLTPQLSLRYTTLDVDDYSEDGGLDLRVEYDSIDTLASELGVSASTIYAAGDWRLAPTARLAWVHEYLGENEAATARYADQSYVQEGFDPDENFASVGVGVEASNDYGVSISVDYRGTFGSDYTSNQGWLNLRYAF